MLSSLSIQVHDPHCRRPIGRPRKSEDSSKKLYKKPAADKKLDKKPATDSSRNPTGQFIKRGRGRPRKYPLPTTAMKSHVVTQQGKSSTKQILTAKSSKSQVHKATKSYAQKAAPPKVKNATPNTTPKVKLVSKVVTPLTALSRDNVLVKSRRPSAVKTRSHLKKTLKGRVSKVSNVGSELKRKVTQLSVAQAVRSTAVRSTAGFSVPVRHATRSQNGKFKAAHSEKTVNTMKASSSVKSPPFTTVTPKGKEKTQSTNKKKGTSLFNVSPAMNPKVFLNPIANPKEIGIIQFASRTKEKSKGAAPVEKRPMVRITGKSLKSPPSCLPQTSVTKRFRSGSKQPLQTAQGMVSLRAATPSQPLPTGVGRGSFGAGVIILGRGSPVVLQATSTIGRGSSLQPVLQRVPQRGPLVGVGRGRPPVFKNIAPKTSVQLVNTINLVNGTSPSMKASSLTPSPGLKRKRGRPPKTPQREEFMDVPSDFISPDPGRRSTREHKLTPKYKEFIEDEGQFALCVLLNQSNLV